MTRQRIEYLADFVIVQMNHWALFPVMMLLICLSKSFVPCDDPNVLFWLLCGFLPFAFYLGRILTNSLAKLALVHVGFLAVHILLCLFFCESTSSKLFYILVGVGYGIYSMYIRMTKPEFTDTEFLMPVAVGLSVVSSFMAHYLEFTQWDAYFLIPLIAVFGLYFLGCYLKNYLYFLKVNDSSTGHIPEKEIFQSGSKLAFGFALLAMLFLFLISGVEWLKVILDGVREVILSIMRFLFSLLPESEAGEPIPDNTPLSGGGMPAQGEIPEPSPFWNAILILLSLTILGFCLFALYKAIKRFIAFIIKQMKYRPAAKERVNEKVMDVREKCSIEKNTSSGKKTSIFEAFTPKERIRKLYKKHILSAKHLRSLTPGNHEEADPGLLTAREWGQLLEEKDMPAIYEKARYSNAPCTAEDFRLMKEACK